MELDAEDGFQLDVDMERVELTVDVLFK